jgi:hypothetical protein
MDVAQKIQGKCRMPARFLDRNTGVENPARSFFPLGGEKAIRNPAAPEL